MSEPNGNEPTPQAPEGGQDPKPDTSKIFSNGYNEGVKTQEKRLLDKFSEITGQEFNSIDDVYGWGKTSSQKLAESISDPTQTDEYKTLQSKVKDLSTTVETLQSEKTSIQNQYKFDSIHSEASNKLKESAEFVIPESDAKDLFNAKHNVEWKDGNPVVKKNGVPVLDDAGNYRPLQSVLTDFYKTYTKPATDGTGGGSGDGGGVKPSFKEFQEANKSKDYEKVQKLYDQASAAGGWKESDAPSI